MSTAYQKDIHLKAHTQEELVSAQDSSFPVSSFGVRFDDYARDFVPWHWHSAIEFVYVESGAVVYTTPGRTVRMETGSCAVVNSMVLHSTSAVKDAPDPELRIHQIAPALLSGERGGRIEARYFAPYIENRAFDIIEFPSCHPCAGTLKGLSAAAEDRPWGYEAEIRAKLTAIWIEAVRDVVPAARADGKKNEAMRRMIDHINQNLKNKITVRDLADAAFTSERDCYRVFHECMKVTPGDYILKCRMQKACRLLRERDLSIIMIAEECGMSLAYFSSGFKKRYGVSPTQYRNICLSESEK